MTTIINGKPTKPMPSKTEAAIARGVPQRVAVATTTKPRSQVRVG